MRTSRKSALFLTAVILILSLGLMAAKLPGAEQGGLPLTAHLTGEAEVPGPGDPDGSGTAYITLNPGQETVCWQITVSDIILPAIGAHIHIGGADVAGPVVVPLTSPDESGMSSGCTDADRELIKDIIQNVDGYYVNVHTTDFPGGAVRGQLHR
jgi:CHRD domain